jgi:hypothetical protein
MKGFDEHDAVLHKLLHQQSHRANEMVLPVLLWTNKDGDGEKDDDGEKDGDGDKDGNGENKGCSSSHRQSITIEQLHAELSEAAAHAEMRSGANNSIRLVVIALEGTWGHARRMATKLPTTLRSLQLSEQEIFGWRSNGVRRSLLHPLRQQKKLQVTTTDDASTATATTTATVLNTHKVCTAEAVVSALVAVAALTVPAAEAIMALAEQKVTRTIQYQGKSGRPTASGPTSY